MFIANGHVPSKELAAYYFDRLPEDPGSYTCRKCGKVRKCAPKTGYTNLRNHLAACVGTGYEDKYKQLSEASIGTLDRYINHKEEQVYEVIKWIVER